MHFSRPNTSTPNFEHHPHPRRRSHAQSQRVCARRSADSPWHTRASSAAARFLRAYMRSNFDSYTHTHTLISIACRAALRPENAAVCNDDNENVGVEDDDDDDVDGGGGSAQENDDYACAQCTSVHTHMHAKHIRTHMCALATTTTTSTRCRTFLRCSRYASIRSHRRCSPQTTSRNPSIDAMSGCSVRAFALLLLPIAVVRCPAGAERIAGWYVQCVLQVATTQRFATIYSIFMRASVRVCVCVCGLWLVVLQKFASKTRTHCARRTLCDRLCARKHARHCGHPRDGAHTHAHFYIYVIHMHPLWRLRPLLLQRTTGAQAQ